MVEQIRGVTLPPVSPLAGGRITERGKATYTHGEKSEIAWKFWVKC